MLLSGSQFSKKTNTNKSATKISVASGKGGVGKTSFAVNLAISLSEKGKRVFLIDADFSLANLDVCLGIIPQNNIYNFLMGECQIKDLIHTYSNNLKLIPGSSGSEGFLNMDSKMFSEFKNLIYQLERVSDYIIFDMPPGINPYIMELISQCDDNYIILGEDVLSVADAYSLIKNLKLNYATENFNIVSNKVYEEGAGRNFFKNLNTSLITYVGGVKLKFLGEIFNNKTFVDSIIKQTPICGDLNNKKNQAYLFFDKLSKNVINKERKISDDNDLSYYIDRYLN